MKRKGRVVISVLALSLMFVTQGVKAEAANPLEYTGPQLDPYKAIEAEINFGVTGREIEEEDGWTRKVIRLEKGDYFQVNDVNFDKGLSKITINARGDEAAIVEIRRDKPDGRKLGEVKVNKKSSYANYACPTEDIFGKNNVYFVCTLGTCYIDAWKADGTQDKKPLTEADINKPPVVVNPYEIVETETMENGGGFYERNGIEYSPICEEKMVCIKNVMFSRMLKGFEINARTRYYDTVMEIHLDDPESEPIAKALIRSPGFSTSIAYTSEVVSGMHDVYFTVNNPVDFDYWKALDNPRVKENPVITEPTEPEQPEEPKQPEQTEVPVEPVQPEQPQQPETSQKPELELNGSVNEWDGGYQINFTLTNNSDKPKSGWKITMGKVDINIANSWCVNVDEDDDLYMLTPQGWNSTLAPGQTIEFGVSGKGELNVDTVRYMIE